MALTPPELVRAHLKPGSAHGRRALGDKPIIVR